MMLISMIQLLFFSMTVLFFVNSISEKDGIKSRAYTYCSVIMALITFYSVKLL